MRDPHCCERVEDYCVTQGVENNHDEGEDRFATSFAQSA